MLPGDDIVVDADVDTGATVGGDETVPGDSANPGPVSPAFVDTRNFPGIEHTKLSSNRTVITAVRAATAGIV